MKAAVRVLDAREAAERDRGAIDAGIPSRALMQRAGAAAAGEIALRYAPLLRRGVDIYAGPGNNGGDAWVVARALAAAGVRVSIAGVGEPTAPDARSEADLARPLMDGPAVGAGAIVVDGLLGTGARGAPRAEVADAIGRIADARDRGAMVVSLDVPSGVDATTGDATLAVTADLTLTFGSIKRGLLVARQRAGRIVVIDIGLGSFVDRGEPPLLVTQQWVRQHLPRIGADSHKGTRKRLAIVGGGSGMAGACMLASRAAMRSGVGMVRLVVAPDAIPVVQCAEPRALAAPWPTPGDESAIRATLLEWADAVVVGPGLGRSRETRALVELVLGSWRGPVVLDADALNVFESDAPSLARLLAGRQALLTPHAAEFARLTGLSVAEVLRRRFDAPLELARATGAAVLLKGVPTVISAPGGQSHVSAAGSPVLAAAGSGDVLSGVAGTLLAQIGDAAVAGACAAWAHGRAGEIANATRAVRGVSLDDVIHALADVWTGPPRFPRYPVIAELPPVGDPL